MNHPDHEIEMARSELYSIAKYAMALHEMLENVSELDGIQGWQQSKITRAADYMESVYQSLTHEMKFRESAPEGVAEDDDAVAAFLAKGGKIQHAKPQKGPKTPGLSYASKHIGAAGGRGSSKGKVSGLGANTGKTSNKPVVTAEAGYGRNKDYNPGFASPHAPTNLGRGPDHRGLGQELAHERNNYGVHFDGKKDPWKVFASQREAENIAKSLRAKGRQVDVYVTGLPATNESVEENKKGVRAVKHTTKPRNPVMAGDKPGKATVTHKNKKKDQQRGVEKHKGKEPAYESRLWNSLSQHLEK
jgi:hypothetical protein